MFQDLYYGENIFVEKDPFLWATRRIISGWLPAECYPVVICIHCCPWCRNSSERIVSASRNAVGNTFHSAQNSVPLSVGRVVSLEWKHTRSFKKRKAKAVQSVVRFLVSILGCAGHHHPWIPCTEDKSKCIMLMHNTGRWKKPSRWNSLAFSQRQWSFPLWVFTPLQSVPQCYCWE